MELNDRTATVMLPGQLGTPGMTLRTDPRADPRMVAALAAFDLDIAGPPPPVTPASPLDERLEFCGAAESGFDAVFDALYGDLPPVKGVTGEVQTIEGVDGNRIPLYVHRPASADGPLPCIFHIHGGGMAMLEAAGTSYQRWRSELAALGLVVVGVEFRNAAGKLGNHPFPAGLNDCVSGLQWVLQHRHELGASTLVVSGESGGGNLTLAAALRAKREGWISQIDGVYAQCPYISNTWAYKPGDLPSLHENDEYFISCALMAVLASVYDPDGLHADDPTCWPYHAAEDDVRGLPPHVISVNQLDPLRDEGLAYYRTLLGGGVSAVSRTVNGTCHAGDAIFRKAMPEVYAATVRDIAGFAHSLPSA